MKKAFFAAFATAVMMAACTQVPTEKQYVINVTTNWCNDGDTIYLVSEDTIGVETVKDNKVTFTGKYERAFGAYLDFSNSEPRTIVNPFELFIVEDTITNVLVRQGEIMYDNPDVEGGQAQQLLSQIHKTVWEKWEKSDQGKALLEEVSPEEGISLYDLLLQNDSIETDILNLYADFIIANMPSDFSDIGFVIYGGIAKQIEDITGNKNENIRDRILNAFAEKQPDASKYKIYLEMNK